MQLGRPLKPACCVNDAEEPVAGAAAVGKEQYFTVVPGGVEIVDQGGSSEVSCLIWSKRAANAVSVGLCGKKQAPISIRSTCRYMILRTSI